MSHSLVVTTIISTKGGVGKTTIAANLGAILAETYRVLLIDADVQPTLSSHYPLAEDGRADAGLTQLIHTGSFQGTISRTVIPNLDLVYSDDPEGALQMWAQQTPDGRFRLRNAVRSQIPDLGYDFVLIDTQGAVGALQDSAVIAGNQLLSPVPCEMPAAREFRRGTVDLITRQKGLQSVGVHVGHTHCVLNQVSKNSDVAKVRSAFRRLVDEQLSELVETGISIGQTEIPRRTVFNHAASARLPVHNYETRRPAPDRPSAREIMLGVVGDLFGDEVKGRIIQKLGNETMEAVG